MSSGYLGIDIGLSGVRAAVVTARGRLLAKARRETATGTTPPLRLLNLAEATAREALAKAGQVKIEAIALAALGPVPILLDEKGKTLACLPLFGGRGNGLSSGEPEDDLAARLLHFADRSPGTIDRVRTICDLTGYLVSRLTGHLAMDRVTRDDYVRLALPRRTCLPAMIAGEEVVGGLTRAAAWRLGLPAGTPVAAGTYDSIADLLAAGFGASRRSVIVLGSTMVMGALTKDPLKDPQLRSTPYLGDGWFSGGWTNCAGMSLALAGRMLGRTVARHAGPTPLVWPYLAGERAPVWSSQATGLVAGLGPETTAAALHHGFLEGVALSAADIAERLEVETGRIRHWTVIGGATRNDALMSELSCALGATLSTVQGAADHLGPALLAARSAGIDIRLPVVKRHVPRPHRYRAYREKLTVYRQVFQAVKPLLGEIYRVTQLGSSSR